MGEKKEMKKGLIIQALEDGVKKAVEITVVTVSIGYPPNIILLVSTPVFVCSLILKTVKIKISEGR